MTKEQTNVLIDYILNEPNLKEKYEEVTISSELVQSFRKKFVDGGEIIVITASWCADCTELVPKFGKILVYLPEWNITLLNRDTLSYEDRIKYNVQRIPTFIFFNHNKREIGRIVEQPKFGSLEEDMLVFNDKE
ncbi:MAG: hypothetical protein HeimC3_34760 [Candidatus Heimdallarchaeota archaeon LC_3]|nr:MAG: hypothetical protein HeimC3_34760 [Candidatus Heimdallarchaeota archaeon LC_3]